MNLCDFISNYATYYNQYKNSKSNNMYFLDSIYFFFLT